MYIHTTHNCGNYSWSCVEELRRKHGQLVQWEHFVHEVRRAGGPVSQSDILMAALLAASPEQRLLAVKQSTMLRVKDQERRWPNQLFVGGDLRLRLLAWSIGSNENLVQLKNEAYALYTASGGVHTPYYAVYAAVSDVIAYTYAARGATGLCANNYEAISYDAAGANEYAAIAAKMVVDATSSATCASYDVFLQLLLYICRLLDGVEVTYLYIDNKKEK